MKKIIIVFLISFVSAIAQNVYYLDASATGSSNGTSRADAWTTLDEVRSNVTTGTVYVYDGSYEPGAGNTNYSALGTATDYVEFIAMGEGVFFEDLDGSLSQMFYGATTGGYLYFRGIKFHKLGITTYLFQNMKGVILQSCEFYGSWQGRFCDDVDDIEIYNSILTLNDYCFYSPVNLKMVNCSFYSTTGSNGYVYLAATAGTLELQDCAFIQTSGSLYLLYQGGSYFSNASLTNVYFSTGIDTTNVSASPSINVVTGAAKTIFSLDVVTPPYSYSLSSSSPLLNSGVYGQDIGYLSNYGIKIQGN